MRDRLPTKVLGNGALRYGVYDESGNFLRHEYLALDDAPTDQGTDLSKATLLQDSTEVSLFGAAADRTVDDAFMGLAGQLKLIMGDMASITVTLTDSAGAAIPGVLVQGILSESGQAVYSSDSGVVSGYISEGSQTIKVTGYADIADYSETISVTKGTTISKTVTLNTRNFLKITSSQSIKFSGNVETVDVTAVGGGGGGGASIIYGTGGPYYGGSGGGGGYCTVQDDMTIDANTSYPVIIGAGGAGGTYSNSTTTSNGHDGGASSFLGVSANGGGKGLGHGTSSSSGGAGARAGGTGNGNGGYNGYTNSASYIERNPSNGSAGSTSGYSSFNETSRYGGGGAGGYAYSKSDRNAVEAAGGADFGTSSGVNAAPNTGGGGGGGYARYGQDGNVYSDGGNGGSGCVTIRMHLRSAA